MAAAFVKAALVPGSLGFLMVGLVVGLVLLYAGQRPARWARSWITALTLLYLVMSLGPVSGALTAGLEGAHGSIENTGARGARVVVAIGEGAVTYADGPQAIHQMGRHTAFTVLETERAAQIAQTGVDCDVRWDP